MVVWWLFLRGFFVVTWWLFAVWKSAKTWRGTCGVVLGTWLGAAHSGVVWQGQQEREACNGSAGWVR